MEKIVTLCNRRCYTSTADGYKKDLSLSELKTFGRLLRKENRLCECYRELLTTRTAINDIIRALGECGYFNIQSHFFDFHFRDGRLDYMETSYPMHAIALHFWERKPAALPLVHDKKTKRPNRPSS